MFASLHAPGNLPLLLECAEQFSPMIEETSADTIAFDIDGLTRLYGDPPRLAAAIVRRAGLPAQLAIAANPDAAVHAACGLPGPTVLPPGGEAPILAPLPVLLLGGSAEFARQLHQWGVRRFGEFAALPAGGVASRLGAEGVRLHRLARGAGYRRLRLRPPPRSFAAARSLEESLDLFEPLLALLEELAAELCARLRFHGLATSELRLELGLERAPAYPLTLRLPVPVREPEVFVRLLRLELQEKLPPAPIERIAMELEPVEPRPVQHGLYLPAAPEPEKLEVTLTRIRRLVGAGNLGAPALADTYRPDAYHLGRLAAMPGPEPPSRPILALRRFRPPWPAEVWCGRGGQPVRVRWPRGGGRVAACAGPWDSSGDWWTAEIWERREWDVEIDGQGLYRLFEDRRAGRWGVEGSYD